MPPRFAQQFLNSGNGPRANPHKLISDRKRALEALGDALVSVKRADADMARKVATNLAATEPSVAKCKEIAADLESIVQSNNELDSEISAILESPELASLLADRRALPEVASRLTEGVGRQLLSLSSAYLGTPAYMDMAVSHSQQAPDITGHAAAQLAHKLETLGIDHQRAIEEKDERIADLKKDLATAKNEATSSAALAQEREAALTKQKADTKRLREHLRTTLDRLVTATDDNDRRAEDMETLDSVLGDEILKRGELSKENTSLAATNEGLVQDTRRLQQERDKARMNTGVVISRLACVLGLHSLDVDPLEMEDKQWDGLIQKITKDIELAKTERSEAEGARTVAEAEVDRLRNVVEETERKSFQQSQLISQLRAEAAGLNKVSLSKGERMLSLQKSAQQQTAALTQRELQLRQATKDKEALQNRLAEVELECNSLKAVADKNAENVQAEVARTNDAMDQLSRTHIESTKAASDLQVRCSALEADKRKLTLDLDLLATRLATADELARSATAEATQLSTRLSESEAEIGALKISCGVKDSKNRELERNIAKETVEFSVRLSEVVQKGDEKLQVAQQLANTLQSQLEHEGQDRVRKLESAVADLESSLTQANTNLATEKKRATQVAADLVAVQGSLAQANKEIAAKKAHTTRAETELAVVQESLTRANADIVTEKGRVRSLEQDRQGALDALVEYFSASSDASPLWTRFALAAQTHGSCYADGGVPVLWALELWDVDEGHMEPHVQAWDLYAALCNKAWSGCILGSLTRFIATLAHTNKVHVATTQLLLDQAFQALERLDATPAAHICGLAICQLLAVLRRWPALSVPSLQGVADQLPELAAMLVVGFLLDRELTPSPNRLDYGQLSLFSEPDSVVGFIVDKHLGLIRAVNKARCTFETGVLVSIRAPDGQDDMVMPLDSVPTVNWFLRYWLM